MQHPRVLMIYNEPVLPPNHPDYASEFDVVESAEYLESCLKLRFNTQRISFNYDPSVLIDTIREYQPDVVFNLFEGLANQTDTEISVVALLEWMQIPYTGSPSLAIGLGRDKYRTKHLLQNAGLPTARFVWIEQLPVPKWDLGWPAIVKPATQDASVGIEQASVVTNQKQLVNRVEYVLATYGGPVLIEEFIAGREFHVSLFEDPTTPNNEVKMVPLSEIRFDHKPEDGWWPIYSYTAKWDTESREHLAAALETPVELPKPILNRIQEIGEKTFKLLGLRDYYRLDIRLTPDGTPYVLEVNPNPYLNSILLVHGLQSMGRVYNEFLFERVWMSLKRAGKIESIPSDGLMRKQTTTV
jgi:D-alanine-D-alanine ligase